MVTRDHAVKRASLTRSHYFLFLRRPGSDYWLALSLTNWLLLKPPTKSLLILMLLFKLMLNESIDVWRQICDSLELDNSLTTALRKFVTFGQSLFRDNLLWNALKCCWVCVYDMGRRQPWESAPRKLDPSVQNQGICFLHSSISFRQSLLKRK